MKAIQPEVLSQISGGNNGLNLRVDFIVATAQIPDIANILTQAFLGTMNPTALAAIIMAQPEDFNAIKIVDISIQGV